MPPETPPPPPPDWLPARLADVWKLLAVEPVLLALAVILAGVLLAAIGRGLIVFSGGKVTARTKSDVDDKILRLFGRVVAVAVVYLSVLVALEAERAELVAMRNAGTINDETMRALEAEIDDAEASLRPGLTRAHA